MSEGLTPAQKAARTKAMKKAAQELEEKRLVESTSGPRKSKDRANDNHIWKPNAQTRKRVISDASEPAKQKQARTSKSVPDNPAPKRNTSTKPKRHLPLDIDNEGEGLRGQKMRPADTTKKPVTVKPKKVTEMEKSRTLKAAAALAKPPPVLA
ncbi:hypothetical protein B0H10DRAFT_2237720 [Mycena sp. CBHHK59/15]|nr:hypothetical protein B0H10DRAFT_2237720 [Mycena sp. CBHHK59/15]